MVFEPTGLPILRWPLFSSSKNTRYADYGYYYVSLIESKPGLDHHPPNSILGLLSLYP